MDKQLFAKVLNNKAINIIIFKYLKCRNRLQYNYYRWNELVEYPHVMAGNNYFEMLKQHLELNRIDYDYNYLRHIYRCAIEGGSIELLQYLLDKLLYCTASLRYGPENIYQLAITYNRSDIAEYIIKRYKQCFEIYDM